MSFNGMKIYHTVSNKVWGGGEQTVLDLSRRQLADGIEVELFCVAKEEVIRPFRDLGVPVHAMALGGALDFASALKMSRVLKHNTARAVHVHNFKEAFTAAYARRLSGRGDIRLVMCRNLTRKGKNSWLYRWLYRQLDCIVFDSQLAMDTFLSTSPAIDRSKLLAIFNGVVLPRGIVAADVRTAYGISAGERVVMYHGRLDPEKGLDVLIEAVALLRAKPFRLLLVGRGSDEYTAHLKALIAGKGVQDKVVFTGFVNPVMAYVASADIGVLPSIVPEGCSLSAQEHLSQGHPVVVTNNGGQREYVVEGSNGLLVPPGDAQALANALAALIDNEELRQRMGRQAKADFDDHLSYEHFYEKIMKIY